MARKEPVRTTCPDCGADVWTTSTKLPVRCGTCRAAREAALNRARNRRYVDAHRDDPERKARWRANSKKWRAANREKVRDMNRAWKEKNAERRRAYQRDYYAAHAEQARAYATQYRAERMKQSGRDGTAVMGVLSRGNLLQECPRMRIKAASLPCGKREECFGAVRCGMCPAGATPPGLLDRPWIPSPVLAAGW